MTIEVTGTNPQGTWLAVVLPQSGETVWLPKGTARLGDARALPVIAGGGEGAE